MGQHLHLLPKMLAQTFLCDQEDRAMPHKTYPEYMGVRRLYASDQDEICDHFQRLEIHARRARFCGAVSNDAVSKYARDIFRYDSIACGAFANGRLRGVAELRGLVQSWPLKTEIAFSVETEWQNVGIGDAMFERILAMAQNRGVRTIHMVCLKENSRMRHLAKKHNALFSIDQVAVEAVLHPYWPTLTSMAKEIIGEARCYAQTVFEANRS